MKLKHYIVGLSVIAFLSYLGYSNYQSYPKPFYSLVHHPHKAKWNPPGRDKPVFKSECNRKTRYTGTKYEDMEITKYKWKWGI